MQSIAKKIGLVAGFPQFQGRSLYMHKTRMDDIVLPQNLMDYATTVQQMLAPLQDLNAVCYVTIDEKVVHNTTHRRGGIHVDYNWYEDIQAHATIGTHRVSSGIRHQPPPTPPAPGWGTPRPMWGLADVPGINGGLLLTSNYPACQVYNGEFDGELGEGGCCAAIDVHGLLTEVMPANAVYYLNALGIHESMPITELVNRSLVRIALHPDYIMQ